MPGDVRGKKISTHKLCFVQTLTQMRKHKTAPSTSKQKIQQQQSNLWQQ